MHISDEQIHPEYRTLGKLMRHVLPYYGETAYHVLNPTALKLINPIWPGLKTTAESTFTTRPDGSHLRFLIVRPKNPQKEAPGILWLHGGGYATGFPGESFPYIDRFAELSGSVAVLPYYRLSTEAVFPAALDDAVLALHWLKDHAAELGIRSDQIFVGGESAGGGLAAAICLYERDHNGVPIAFQIPLYPMLDDRMDLPSAVDNDAPVWNSKSNRIAWKMYLGENFGSNSVSEYAAPARASDLHNLPPACSFIGTIEVFYDETCAYMEGLKAAGVDVHFKTFHGCFHTFDLCLPNSTPSREAAEFLTESFSYAVSNYFNC